MYKFLLIWSAISLIASGFCLEWHKHCMEYHEYVLSGLCGYLGIPASVFGIFASIYLIVISR